MTPEEMESEQRAYALVDRELRNYAMPQVPPSLFPAIMRQVQADAMKPRLRFRRLDIIVCAFIALMILCTALFWHLPAASEGSELVVLSSPWLMVFAVATFSLLVFISGLAFSDHRGGI